VTRARGRPRARAWLAALAALAGLPGVARPQDFALPAPDPLDAPGIALETALPRAATGVVASGATIDWYGVPGLVTRAIAIDLGSGAWRAAGGVSQTGTPEVGWTTLALAGGAAGEGWGFGARALARRDRIDAFAWRTDPAAGGLEAGAGGWVALGATTTLWASAPSVAVSGAAPPLARALETGLRWRADGLALWLAHRSAPAGYGAASLAAGACVTTGPARVWLAAHDAPVAGGVGVALRHGALGIGAEVDSHPWLAPLTRVAVSYGGRGP